ncbi:hypothetical protein CGRA01v4_09900 [Colletotrichum graminicola]|uniref:DUF7888 domain-containing protein n=1 Tax=Colletotrichum graminicola (strain M1.001 / M2 / FGSC 10212) TaxID=645133 RepID=E3QHM9_COLGM|nr:uncharacterized protein GLRG_05511 [Colletotrichum graminicola M1.001]EFQ30367.1 hypothetical protein GLRG_05511 [Colletotrichum graminicola M1.001]WDK18615.1 hypothetical protein CGRA01v4_09900 [Colletotrichum graminicola]
MRFSAISLVLASALAVNAAVVPVMAKTSVGVENGTGSHLAERQAGVAGAITSIGSSAMSVATGAAVNLVTDSLRAIVDWTKARETFTKQTTDEMWKKNPDPAKFPAAVCYNKGYRLADPNGVDGKASVTLRSNLLKVNYDCMYMTGPNQFFTDSDGGLINLSYSYDGNRCTFDQSTGDLTCK